MNFCRQEFHRRRARWNTVVDEHWSAEVAVGEHERQMRKVRADGRRIVSLVMVFVIVMRVIGRDFDRSSVRGQAEVMGSGVVREAHGLIAILFDDCLMGICHVLFVHWAFLHGVILAGILGIGCRHETQEYST